MGDARDPSPGAPARRARSGLWAGAGLVAAAALALLLAGGARGACEEAGPDAGGYKCETTDFDWKDTSGGTDLSLGDDDYSAAIDLPFAFRFYGADKTRAWVGSNGLLCFATAWCDWPSKAEIVCVSLPGQPCVPQIVYTVPKPPDPLVTDDFLACFWEDLDPTAGGTVRHKAVGDAPNRVFVVEFKEVKHKGSSLKNTFQIQLLEKGEARCMLDSVSSDGDLAPTVVAIENAAGSAAVVYKYGGVSESDRGVRFFCALNTAPRNLDAATGPGVGEVSLTWEAPGEGCAPQKSRVYRGTESGGATFLAELGEVTAFTDSGLPNGAVRYYQVTAVNPAGEGPRSGGACSPPYPWTNGLTPPTSRPCPLPAGWRERVLLTQDVPAPAYVEGISTPAVSNYGVTVDGRPRAGSPYYDLTIGVFSRSTFLAVPTFGLLQEPVHVELLRGSQSVSTPAWVRLTVSQRSDPSQQGCALGFGPCAPLPVTWRSLEWLYFQGAGAMLLVEAQLLDGQGRVLSGQVLTIPYGGQFAGG